MIIDTNKIPHGMTLGALRLLCGIADDEGCGAISLATRYGISIEAVHAGLIDLESRGLTRRCPESSLYLTAEGVRSVARLKPEMWEEAA